MLLKIVDVGAKWAAIATLLSVFTGVSITQGILITGVHHRRLLHGRRTVGRRAHGTGAVHHPALAGIAMLVTAMAKLDGIGSTVDGLGQAARRATPTRPRARTR